MLAFRRVEVPTKSHSVKRQALSVFEKQSMISSPCCAYFSPCFLWLGDQGQSTTIYMCLFFQLSLGGSLESAGIHIIILAGMVVMRWRLDLMVLRRLFQPWWFYDHKSVCGIWPSAEHCAPTATVGDVEKL